MVTVMNRNRVSNLSRIFFILIVSILAACSGAGKNVLRPEVQLRAEKSLERGVRAQQKGEIHQAEQLLNDALFSSSSIEDNPTRIAALINLARLNRLNGNPDKAMIYVNLALNLCVEHPEWLSEAAYEKAHTELDLDNQNEALRWAVKSLNAEQGTLKGVRRNLLARIQSNAGNTNAAVLSATAALNENLYNELPEEAANSLRILGTIELEGGRLDAARKLILEALEIDKRIGASPKIGLDLEKLAAVADGQEALNLKAEYLERAYSVHVSAGRRDKALNILQQLAEVYSKTGNSTQAEKVRLTYEQLNAAKTATPIEPQTAPVLPTNRSH